MQARKHLPWLALGVLSLAALGCGERTASGVVAGGGLDDPTCEPATQCAVRACQSASSCTFAEGSDEIICAYSDAAENTSCALGSAGGSEEGICLQGRCVEPGTTTCSANSACDASESCIDGLCTEPADLGGSCDAGDDDDCAGALICTADGVCLVADGDACTENSQCQQSCIAGICAATSDEDGSCDTNDNDDCMGDLECSANNTCAPGTGSPCTSNSQCAQTCIDGTCGPFAQPGGSCDVGDPADCAAGTCVSGVCGPAVNNGVFIVEVFDHLAYDCATISELEFYDRDGTLIAAETTNTDIYDTAQDGASAYWPAGNWSQGKLFDGNIDYRTVTEGRASSTIFNHSTEPGEGTWTRFAVFLSDGAVELSRIRIALGSPEGRIPMDVKIYAASSYRFDTNVQGRQNTDLRLVWTVTPEDTAAWYVTHWEEIDF